MVSGKAKKEQLQKKRERKQERTRIEQQQDDQERDDAYNRKQLNQGNHDGDDHDDIGAASRSASSHEEQHTSTHLNIELQSHSTSSYEINAPQQTRTRKAKLLTTSFAKDSDQSVKHRKEEADMPLDYSLRSKPIIASILPSLDFPKRPKWHSKMSKAQLDTLEQASFRAWLDGIHSKYTEDQLSPFEHNLEVWRQLWRVLEQSQVIMLTADIRNPLLHIPRDLVHYVVYETRKPLVIALTKVDLVDQDHVKRWLKVLQDMFPKVTYTLFAGKAQHTFGTGNVGHRRKILTSKATKVQLAQMYENANQVLRVCLDIAKCNKLQEEENERKKKEEGWDPRAIEDEKDQPFERNQQDLPKIGLVGHPNNGKSSLLNAIMGKHVVSVSRTPGHTKHWQTHIVHRHKEWKPELDSNATPNEVEPKHVDDAEESEEEEEEEDIEEESEYQPNRTEHLNQAQKNRGKGKRGDDDQDNEYHQRLAQKIHQAKKSRAKPNDDDGESEYQQQLQLRMGKAGAAGAKAKGKVKNHESDDKDVANHDVKRKAKDRKHIDDLDEDDEYQQKPKQRMNKHPAAEGDQQTEQEQEDGDDDTSDDIHDENESVPQKAKSKQKRKNKRLQRKQPLGLYEAPQRSDKPQIELEPISNRDEDYVAVAQLCDCPGLVFPVTWVAQPGKELSASERPRAIMECCGLYPISQIREVFSAVRFLAERLPLEKMYNLRIDADNYGSEDQLSAYGICGALADQKGFTMSRGGGAPDFHRAGQMILYDVVDGVILLKFEPPDEESLGKQLKQMSLESGSASKSVQV